MNAIFQVIQNILRRKEQQARCPHCGDPLSPRDGPGGPDAPDSTDSTDARDSDADHCPDCGRPPSGDSAR